ncbi:Mitosis protein dim1 [Pyrenophora tritici-repentis]|nr:Mitosis protein dim1 [Pyrenophora tritici-repentis]
MGSVVLPHLRTGWHVDQAILSEEDRLVLIRFGRDSDPDCMSQDEVLYKIADRVKNFCAIYLCDLDEVPDFKAMYELYDPCTVMFFFRNKHMMCDFGTGNNNKLNWVLEDKQEFVDIIETVYRGAKKGRGLVSKPREPKKTATAAPSVPSEPMILVTINDRLGTKTQVPCLPSDPIKLLKAMVAAKIGRPVHEIMLKRQGERPFHDNLTCADYAISNGVQIDLELNTGD